MSPVRIAVTGPESSGKSVLTQALAAHFHTSYAPEFAREYLSSSGGAYDVHDLDRICRGQIRNEERAIQSAARLCFFDTDMLVIKIWSQFRFGTVSERIRRAVEERTYHFRLLCKPDLPWTPDPFRESPDPAERMELFAMYRRELDEAKADYFIVEGQGENRLNTTLKFLESKGL